MSGQDSFIYVQDSDGVITILEDDEVIEVGTPNFVDEKDLEEAMDLGLELQEDPFPENFEFIIKEEEEFYPETAPVEAESKLEIMGVGEDLKEGTEVKVEIIDVDEDLKADTEATLEIIEEDEGLKEETVKLGKGLKKVNEEDDEEMPLVPELQNNQFLHPADLAAKILNRTIEEQVEKYKKMLDPFLTEIIRNGLTKLTSASFPEKEEEEEEMLKCEKKQNRRFNKVPVKTFPLEEECKAETKDEVKEETEKPEEKEKIQDSEVTSVSDKNSEKKKSGLKIRMKKKNRKSEWVIKSEPYISPKKPAESSPPVLELYLCDVCEFHESTTLAGFRTHQLTHRPPKYICDACSKGFYIKGDLICHIRTHQPVCGLCSRQYKTVELLHQHMVEHFRSPKFYCKTCNKEYSKKYIREHAKRVHGFLNSPKSQNVQKVQSDSNTLSKVPIPKFFL